MTVSGFVIPAFLIVTVVVLVLLWRRGPEKRGAFFVAGLLIVSVVFVLAVTLDGVERAIDEGVEEWRESWQSSLVTRPSDELIEATGVSVTFPRRMEISEADIWVYDDVYPVPGSPLRWEPLYVASEPESWCTVMDATDYAAALDYWRLEDAVAAELTGIEERRGDMLLARISRPLVGLREGGLSSGYYDLPLGRAAYVDLENAGGFSRRHYIVNATDRWIILSCYARDADRLPSDRWESVADSLTVRPARATFEPALSPGPVDKVPAGGGVATPIPAALSLNLTEAALRDIVPFDDCRERFSGMIAGAKVVITCQVDGGVDGDAEVTYAQFDSLKRLQRWWDKEAEGVRAYSFDDALLRCRNGTSAEADHATGRFLCRRKGLRFRVSWTDKGRFLGGIATSDTMPLPDLLEQWQEGDFEPGATKRKVKPTPAATRPPAVAPGADPPGPTPQPEARLRDHVPLEGCRSRKLDTVPGAEAVITCPAGEWVEVTYAGFSRIADLEDWWEQEAGSIRTWPTPTAASRCESGANAEAAWLLDGSDLPAGRFACHLPDLLAAVSWTDTSLLMGGRVDGDTTALPDIYSRWSRGEFGPDRSESTKEPTTTDSAAEAHAFAGLFPSSWTVEQADPDDHFWLFPVIEDDVQWQPVAYATDGTDECALIDATMYADELGFDTIKDALEWELTGFDEDADRAWARLVSLTSLSSSETATGKYLAWALEEIAFVEVESERGELQRYYLHYDGTRWVYFSCRSSHPPDDRWLPRALAVSYEPFEQLVQPVPTPTPSSREARLRDLVPLKDCESRPTRSVAGADAVISCDAPADIGVDYMTFQSSEALQAWWDRQAGSIESVQGLGAIERCEAGEAVESGWYLERVNRLAGRYLCKPATSVRLPTVAWTYEPSLLGGRVTSGDHDLPDLFQRWQRGTYGVDQG